MKNKMTKSLGNRLLGDKIQEIDLYANSYNIKYELNIWQLDGFSLILAISTLSY